MDAGNFTFKRGQGSIILRFKIRDLSDNTGAGKTGLVFNSAGLIISTIADNEATATTYTTTGSTIEDITTLGTYAAPTATKCRFKPVDATNHPGVYELQLADARFAVASAKGLTITLLGVADMTQTDIRVNLTDADPYDAVRGGMTALPNAAAAASGGLIINGANTGTVTLAALTCTGAFTISGGIAVTNSTGNGAGVVITGNGTGHGLSIISGNGATGNGLNVAANSTNGAGVNIAGVGTGHGVSIASGAGATGNGLNIVSSATNGNGVNIAGVGTGSGLVSTGGATGHGFRLVGGGTSGNGIITSTTDGHAFNLACSGSNKHPLAGVVETGYDITQVLQLIAAGVVGKCSISGDTVTFRDLADAADRIVAVTDGGGARSTVTKTVA